MDDSSSKLQALLREAADEIEASVRSTYGWPDVHPAQQHKYDRDIEIVKHIRDAANAPTPPPVAPGAVTEAMVEAAARATVAIGSDGLKWPLTFDGHAWAVEFNKRFPSVPVDDALWWFCNAIVRGFDTHAELHPTPPPVAPGAGGPFSAARRRSVKQIAVIPAAEGAHPGATMVLCDDGSVWTQAYAPGAGWYRDDLSTVEFGE